jgi:hypothetical protein
MKENNILLYNSLLTFISPRDYRRDYVKFYMREYNKPTTLTENENKNDICKMIDLMKFTNKYEYYSSLCSITFTLFELLENHHIIIKKDPKLEEFYHNLSYIINEVLYMLNSKETNAICKKYDPYECRCDLYYGFTSGIFPLYNELEYIIYKLNDIPDDELLVKMEDNYDYSERNKYRIYNNNFINIKSICHNRDLMIKELENWNKYFDNHNKCKCNKNKIDIFIKTIHNCCYCISSNKTPPEKNDVCKYIKNIYDVFSIEKINIPRDCIDLICSYI